MASGPLRTHAHDPAAIRSDFDAIARLADAHGTGPERYEVFLASQVPIAAGRVLDVGCGLGRLAARLAAPEREVIGVDLSPEMIARANAAGGGRRGPSFRCGDFLALDLGADEFDCVLSAATVHHMDAQAAITRMVTLLKPGGRLILHDLRRDDGPLDWALSLGALGCGAIERLLRTGRLRSPRAVRDAWARHGANDWYPTFREARALAACLLPGAAVFYHWRWRYTVVWDKPGGIASRPPGR